MRWCEKAGRSAGAQQLSAEKGGQGLGGEES